jgi:hypothetical protein
VREVVDGAFAIGMGYVDVHLVDPGLPGGHGR